MLTCNRKRVAARRGGRVEGWQRTLVGLAVDDPATIASVLSGDCPLSRLDARTESLVRISAATASGASGPTFERILDDALDAGASEEEVVSVLIACAPLIGASRLVRSAPSIATALHFDTDEALESLDGI
jgi:alkylhydroperoxidase/carboxymuconolactone decarboxylase family protein YurZ